MSDDEAGAPRYDRRRADPTRRPDRRCCLGCPGRTRQLRLPGSGGHEDFPFTKDVAGIYTVGVPANWAVNFTLIGGGGAGGNDVGGAGGAGAKLTGQLPARNPGYLLTITVGGGGSIGQTGTGDM